MPKGLLGRIKKLNVFHHPVQAKNLNFNSYTFINILYYESNMTYNLTPKDACYPYKMIYFINNIGVEISKI